MADITTVAAKTRPLTGAIIRRFAAASTNVAVGKWVYVKTDGTIELTDADAEGSAQGRGYVVAIGTDGATTAAVGDMCDVVMFGPVETGASGMTEGAVLYASTTAGVADHTAPAAAGDFPFILGWAMTDSAVFVNPQVAVPTANGG